ncbi:MAG: TetR family transcriptional regulator [Burkholderiales bacterium]|nr:TetR family transcriptional regulator [Burkholderiales bacterium]
MPERPGSGPSARKAADGQAATHRRVRDPHAMRQRILDAATAEFAAHGFGGARVEHISRAAATVDRMLYYYFGSKEGLFRAVLERAYEKLGAAEQGLDLDHLDPVQGMRELVAFTWRYYIEHPEFIRLLNSENLYKGQHLRQSRRVQSLSFPLLSILTRLLKRGAASGVFRKRLDPFMVYLTIASLAYFYLSNRYTLSRFLGADLMAESRQRRWLRHITDLVLAHVAAEPVAAAAGGNTRRRARASV